MGKHSAGGPRAPGLEPTVSEEQGPREGSRRSRLRRKRRRSLLLRSVAGLLTGLAIVGVLAATNPFGGVQGDSPSGADGARGQRAAREAITTLVFGTQEKARVPDALWLMLFNHDPRERKGSAIYVPAHTAAEIPGRGLEPLSSAYASGGVPLLLVSVENLLGIEVDRYLELSDRDARVLFSEMGTISVDVPEEVRVPAGNGNVRLAFGAGRQDVRPGRSARLLYTRGADVDDIDFGSRHLAFWDAIFDRFDNEPSVFADAIVAAGGALGESDTEPEEHARFFADLARLPRVGFTITTLPVTAIAAGDDELYSTDDDALVEFVAANLERGKGPADEIRVQILNGNGVPGIGQEVAERLVGDGFRVILSGNARRLDYRRTLIVTYDGSDEGQALAERAKRLLRVGRIQISAQPQGIVDLTIVVGEDFLTTL